jgi:hypothetical protein
MPPEGRKAMPAWMPDQKAAPFGFSEFCGAKLRAGKGGEKRHGRRCFRPAWMPNQKAQPFGFSEFRFTKLHPGWPAGCRL